MNKPHGQDKPGPAEKRTHTTSDVLPRGHGAAGGQGFGL
eukprot:SAG22_NODE_19875_length_271_cov_0.552326_1_plen_38_part_10